MKTHDKAITGPPYGRTARAESRRLASIRPKFVFRFTPERTPLPEDVESPLFSIS